MKENSKTDESPNRGNKRTEAIISWDFLGNIISVQNWEEEKKINYHGVVLRGPKDRIKLRGNLKELIKRATMEWEELTPAQKKRNSMKILLCKN
ncbi:MAG: hypothetical protein ACOYMB_00385 [Patescibacteria group bacterium]